MNFKKNKKCKLAIIFMGSILSTSSLLFLASTCSQNIKDNLEINNNAIKSIPKVTIASDKFAAYSYNNSFADKYDFNFTIGVNTLTPTSDWTNGMLKLESGIIKFKAWFEKDERRSISNTEDVVTDPWASIENGNKNQRANMIAIRRTSLVDGSIQFREALSKMINTGSAITWDDITDWDDKGNVRVNHEYATGAYGKQICTVPLNNNSAVSAAINIGSDGSGTMVSELRYNTTGAVTDDSDKISACPELSHTFNNQNIYAGITFVKSNLNSVKPLSNQTLAVYSGDTTFTEQPINFKNIDIPASIKTEVLPSKWLSSNANALDEKISIQMTNGYPGIMTNSVTIIPNDRTGEIKAVFKPQYVLKSGCVASYTGKPFEKVILSGFKNDPNAVIDSEEVNNKSSFNLWILVSIGAGSAVLLAAIIATIIIVLKKKKTVKKNKITTVPLNNARLAHSPNPPKKPIPQSRPKNVPPSPGKLPRTNVKPPIKTIPPKK